VKKVAETMKKSILKNLGAPLVGLEDVTYEDVKQFLEKCASNLFSSSCGQQICYRERQMHIYSRLHTHILTDSAESVSSDVES